MPSDTDPQPEPIYPDLEHDCAVLRELGDIAVKAARMMHVGLSAATAAPRPDIARCRIFAGAIDCLARSGRRSILLRHHLIDDGSAQVAQRSTNRLQVIRRIDNVIELAEREPERAENMRAELHDRVETGQIRHELVALAIAEIIADIIRDLGADPTYVWPRSDVERFRDLYAYYAARAAAKAANDSAPS